MFFIVHYGTVKPMQVSLVKLVVYLMGIELAPQVDKSQLIFLFLLCNNVDTKEGEWQKYRS